MPSCRHRALFGVLVARPSQATSTQGEGQDQRKARVRGRMDGQVGTQG